MKSILLALFFLSLPEKSFALSTHDLLSMEVNEDDPKTIEIPIDFGVGIEISRKWERRKNLFYRFSVDVTKGRDGKYNDSESALFGFSHPAEDMSKVGMIVEADRDAHSLWLSPTVFMPFLTKTVYNFGSKNNPVAVGFGAFSSIIQDRDNDHWLAGIGHGVVYVQQDLTEFLGFVLYAQGGYVTDIEEKQLQGLAVKGEFALPFRFSAKRQSIFIAPTVRVSGFQYGHSENPKVSAHDHMDVSILLRMGVNWR